MTRIDDWQSGPYDGELTAGDVSSVVPSIDGKPVIAIKLEGVCGSLLYIEGTVVKLFHTCRYGKRKGNELRCPQCLAILETMRRIGNDYRECLRNTDWGKLTCREMTW